jgi:purine nucleoside permease
MFSQLFLAFNVLSAASASLVPAAKVEARTLEYVVKPKVFIISMFDPEADVWYGIPEFDVLALNITIPGFSPLFPDAHCTADGDICQLVTGESGKQSPHEGQAYLRSLQSPLQRSMRL